MAALDEIRHVVVLVLENQSFDHLLGFLTLPDPAQRVAGLTGEESNPPAPPDRGDPVRVSRATASTAWVTDPSPGHSFDDATVQLFGRPRVPVGTAPTNDGFVLSYSQQSSGRHGRPIGPETARTIMHCLDPDQVPIISTLARHFVVCDHWFSSMPGPTWPNRFFLHAATADGSMDTPDNPGQLASKFWTSPYRMRTIFENLAEHGLTWNVYFEDYAQTFALRNLHPFVERFQRFDAFARDAAAGTLPTYSFLEPRYFGVLGAPANDQHPPNDLRDGERLIASIYDTLRSNEDVWRSCLFVLLYDEHGGFYDHVAPPATVAPDAASAATREFGFDRLGVRVPALLVSPWVGRGRADHTVYDHTSLLATMKKMFGLPRFLTARDAQANTFEGSFLASPRTDAPANLTALATRTPGPSAPTDPGRMSPFQRSLRGLAEVLASPPAGHETAPEIGTAARTFLDDTPQTA